MHNYCEYHIDRFNTRQYLWIIYIFDKNFINFYSYIDCTGNIPMWNDICLVDVVPKLYNNGSKIFLVLMIRTGNNFVHR